MWTRIPHLSLLFGCKRAPRAFLTRDARRCWVNMLVSGSIVRSYFYAYLVLLCLNMNPSSGCNLNQIHQLASPSVCSFNPLLIFGGGVWIGAGRVKNYPSRTFFPSKSEMLDAENDKDDNRPFSRSSSELLSAPRRREEMKWVANHVASLSLQAGPRPRCPSRHD